MDNEEIKALLERYDAGTCSEEERAIVEQWFMEYNEQEPGLPPERIREMGEEIFKALPKDHHAAKKYKLWHAIALAGVLLLTVGVAFFMVHNSSSDLKSSRYANDISPGKNRATLVLANGEIINLSDAKTGVIIDAASFSYNDGTVVDSSLRGRNSARRTEPFSELSAANPSHFNDPDKIASSRSASRNDVEVRTPRGGTYQVILPDGTRAWLNAASTISFPLNLRTAQERNIQITGEVYLEVFKDKRRPFKVITGNQEVTVLGTHFNIEAYHLSSIKTTLLEGSVLVASLPSSSSLRGRMTKQSHQNSQYEIASSRSAPRNDGEMGESKVLHPGQQSLFTKSKISVQKVDTELVTAWKNGNMEFEDADLVTIKEMLERWYDVEIIYVGKPITTKFTGSISRSRNISEVLKFLESTGAVHYKIEGRRVSIMQ